MHATLGWVSTLCLALGGIPQAYKSWKDGHSQGLSWGMVILWLSGEVFLVAYAEPSKNWPVVVNGLLNMVIAAIILWYKVWPRNRSPER